MKQSEVKIGSTYMAKVSNRVVPVRIDSKHSRQGWNVTNTATGKRIHVKSAQRLRRPVKVPAKAATKTPAKAAKPAAPSPTSAKGDIRAATDAKAAKDATRAKPGGQGGKRTSAIDAAAEALRRLGKPANCKTLITVMAEQKLWSSPNGKTPSATLYSALLREIQKKGAAARFTKRDRGLFGLNAKATK